MFKQRIKLAGTHLQWMLSSKILHENKVLIRHKNKTLWVSSPNRLCFDRALSFSSKEPETLLWIESMKLGSTFWDIGANIGLYSLAAAISRECEVTSFEPSPYNYQTLVENIRLNKLSRLITPVPFSLSNLNQQSSFSMSDTTVGGALSTFGEKYGYDGNNLNSVFQFQALGFRGDSLLEILKMKPPDYLKIDVDGIEHLILAGCSKMLKKVRSIIIEVSPGFAVQTHEIYKEIEKAGLVPENPKFATADLVLKECVLPTINLIWNRK